MPDCGTNYKHGYGGEKCKQCNEPDDENHRLNDCIKYKERNLFCSQHNKTSVTYSAPCMHGANTFLRENSSRKITFKQFFFPCTVHVRLCTNPCMHGACTVRSLSTFTLRSCLVHSTSTISTFGIWLMGKNEMRSN